MLETILFYGFAAITVGGAFAVAFSVDLRRAAIALVLTFAGIAGLFFVLRAELLAAMQLLLFVGGMVVLLLVGAFVTGGIQVLNGGRRLTAATVLVAVMIGVPLLLVLTRTPWEQEAKIARGADVETVGRALVQARGKDAYLVPLELLSVLLLTVIVGGAYLARPRRPLAPAGPPHIETLAPSPMRPRTSPKTAGGGGGRRA
jgi:NADH-quinone oxidoreductase subunit J